MKSLLSTPSFKPFHLTQIVGLRQSHFYVQPFLCHQVPNELHSVILDLVASFLGLMTPWGQFYTGKRFFRNTIPSPYSFHQACSFLCADLRKNTIFRNLLFTWVPQGEPLLSCPEHQTESQGILAHSVHNWPPGSPGLRMVRVQTFLGFHFFICNTCAWC